MLKNLHEAWLFKRLKSAPFSSLEKPSFLNKQRTLLLVCYQISVPKNTRRDTHMTRKQLFLQLETKNSFLKDSIFERFRREKSHSTKKGALSSQNAFFSKPRTLQKVKGYTSTEQNKFEEKLHTVKIYHMSLPQLLRKLSSVPRYQNRFNEDPLIRKAFSFRKPQKLETFSKSLTSHIDKEEVLQNSGNVGYSTSISNVVHNFQSLGYTAIVTSRGRPQKTKMK